MTTKARDARARERRLLVTFDVRDLRAHPPGQHAGVLLLRLRDQYPEATLDVLVRVLREYDLASLTGALGVAIEKSVRIRRAWNRERLQR